LPSVGIDINNVRSREWAPALAAAGLPHPAHLRHAPHVRDMEPRGRHDIFTSRGDATKRGPWARSHSRMPRARRNLREKAW
jgi:hypothetical protein